MLRVFIMAYLALINLVTFIVYGVDKRLAIRKKDRVPERSLLLMALLGGSVGALLGMFAFRHKTLHLKFLILVPLFLILHLIAAYYGLPLMCK